MVLVLAVRQRMLRVVAILCLLTGVARAEHQTGWQAGGSGVVQAVGRFRVVGHASVELGFFAITHALNLSAGVEVEPYRRGRLRFYASAGGAMAGAFGPIQADETCMPATEECEYVPGGTVLAFGYARVGMRHGFRDGTHAVSVDVGTWVGTWYRTRPSEPATAGSPCRWPASATFASGNDPGDIDSLGAHGNSVSCDALSLPVSYYIRYFSAQPITSKAIHQGLQAMDPTLIDLGELIRGETSLGQIEVNQAGGDMFNDDLAHTLQLISSLAGGQAATPQLRNALDRRGEPRVGRARLGDGHGAGDTPVVRPRAALARAVVLGRQRDLRRRSAARRSAPLNRRDQRRRHTTTWPSAPPRPRGHPA